MRNCSYKRVFLVLAVLSTLAFLLTTLRPAPTSAAINPMINFQGKLTNPDGTNVTDTNYSIVFSIYSVSSGGSAIWTETQPTVASVSGIFQVNLGSVSALPGSVDFNSNPLYLGIKVGADAEMTPRILLTAAPYAFNADRLDGLDSTGLVQLAQGLQTDASTTNPSIAINKTGGTASILQLQRAGSDVLNINNSGAFAYTLSVTNNPAYTITNNGSSNVLTNLAGTGDFIVQDSGTAFATFADDGTITFAPTGTSDVVINQAAGVNTQIIATAVPTVDQFSITNAGQPVVTAGISGLQINYVGGAAAVESSGARVDLTPGTTSGGTWNGFRVVADATGAVSGVNEYGVNLDGPTSPGAGNEVAVTIDANWDAGLQLGSKTTDPGTPATDNIYVYARKVAGRSLLRQKGSSGVSFAYQPALFEQAIVYQGPSTGTTVSSFGNSWTVDNTASTPGASEVFGFSTNFVTAVTANDTTGVSEAVVQHYRGSVANGSNGFFYVARLGFPDATYTSNRIFTGLSSQTMAVMTNSDTPAGDYSGFQFSTARGDTGWRFITRDNTTTSTGVNTLAIAQNKVYDFYIYVQPLGTTINWRVDNITDGTTQEGSTATNLPRTTIAMRAGSGLQTINATARNFRVLKHYIESDR